MTATTQTKRRASIAITIGFLSLLNMNASNGLAVVLPDFVITGNCREPQKIYRQYERDESHGAKVYKKLGSLKKARHICSGLCNCCFTLGNLPGKHSQGHQVGNLECKDSKRNQEYSGKYRFPLSRYLRTRKHQLPLQ